MQVSARAGFVFIEPSGSSLSCLWCLYGQSDPGSVFQLPKLVRGWLCARHCVQAGMEAV